MNKLFDSFSCILVILILEYMYHYEMYVWILDLKFIKILQCQIIIILIINY